MAKIFCALVGEPRSVVQVEINDATSVFTLLKDITALFPITLKDVEPSKLQLFLAEKAGKWLQSCSEDMKKLRRGEKTAAIEDLTLEDKELDPTERLVGLFEHAPTNGVLHALVVVPYAAKRQRLEEKTSMAQLWNLSKMQLQSLPPVKDLRDLLERPLPFRLTLRDSKEAKGIFDPNAPLLSCPDLETAMDYFLDQCQRKFHPGTDASVGSWRKYYEILLSVITNLYLDKGYAVLTRRNAADTAETTLPSVRPNYILQRDCVVLLRGEEQSSVVSMAASVGNLLQKMRGWSTLLYADLPYVLGYATSGSDIQFLAIEKLDGWGSPTPILKCDIFSEKALALKVFYNLAFLLDQMRNLAHRTASFGVIPFCPNDNGKRKIELLDNMVERTITRSHHISTDDLDRLAKIYKTLETLSENKGSSETHLQTVENVRMTTRSLAVRLSPLGDMRKPSEDEACACVRDILTALKYWHSTGYCHGDVRWRNITLVPPSYRRSSYWMLLDMDES